MRRVIGSIETVCRPAMRVGLLAAGVFVIGASGGSPALAACTTVGTTVTCGDTTNQNPPDGFGTPALDNNTINVLTNKKVEGDNDGLNIGTGNTVNNNGTIYGNGSAGVGLATGIEAAGSVTVNNASGATVKGFSNGIVAIAGGSTTTVNNNGTIVAIDAPSGATGIAADTLNLVNNGLILGGYGVFVNGTANITNNVGASIIGANGWGGISTFIANITNNGTVSVTGGGTGIDTNTGIINNNGAVTASGGGSIAVHVNDNAIITNNAGGTITGTSSGAWGIRTENAVTVNNAGAISQNSTNGTAIGARNLANITNSGVISANGNGGTAIGDLGGGVLNLTNSGTITATGTGGFGVAFGTANVTNTASGTILVGKNGTGIAGTTNSLITNFGTITANNTGAFGIEFTGNSNIFNNSGTVRTFGSTGSTIDMCACFSSNSTANNLASGVLDGRITISGSGNTLNNAGLIVITDTGTPIGPGAFVIQNSFGLANTFTQTSTGTLALRMNNAGAVDRLIADALNLSGTLRVVIQQQLYPSVLTSTNKAVQVTALQPPSTTTFSSFVASSPFFTVTPIYTGTSSSFTGIDIQLGRIPFGSVPGETKNQSAVGGALERLYSTTLTGNAATFFINLLNASSVGVLDNLSGEGTAALKNAAIGAGSLFNNAALNELVFGNGSSDTSIIIPPPQYAATPKPRGEDAFASVLKAPPAPATQTGRWRIWTLGFGGYRSIDGNASPLGTASQTIRNYGGALGFDYQVSPDLLAGFSAGGSEGNVSVPDRATTGQLTGGHIGLYGLKTWGAYYLAASGSYARFDNSTTRSISGLGPSETATGRFASDQLSARLELGWKRVFTNYTLTPFVAIEPATLRSHAYAESSVTGVGAPGILGLAFAARTTNSLPTFVGMQADTRIALGGGTVITPYARASWVHEFEPNRQINATFITIPGATFTVDGARPTGDAARIDTGAKIAFDSTKLIFANFSGEWSNSGASYSATAGFKFTR